MEEQKELLCMCNREVIIHNNTHCHVYIKLLNAYRDSPFQWVLMFHSPFSDGLEKEKETLFGKSFGLFVV